MPEIQRAPLEPRSGSAAGGTFLHWAGDGAPSKVYIGGQPCATLRGGVFVTPMCRDMLGATATFSLVLEDDSGSKVVSKDDWLYWEPGCLTSVEPNEGPISGGQEITIFTTDLGDCIFEVRIGEQVCELGADPTSTCARVRLPSRLVDGCVSVEVYAQSGNNVRVESAFTYFTPEYFGAFGGNIALSDDCLTATRVDGLSKGPGSKAVCIGGFPMRRVSQGRYFEIIVEDMCKSLQTFAIGVCVLRPETLRGRLKADKATELERAWIVGYESRGAFFFADKVETRIPSSGAGAWRPAKSVVKGSRVGVLWSGGADARLTIFQDGVEQICLPATGRVPNDDEELFGVVDVNGNVKAVRIARGSRP